MFRIRLSLRFGAGLSLRFGAGRSLRSLQGTLMFRATVCDDLGCLLMCVCVLLVWACEPFASGPSGKSVSYVMVSLYSCHVIVAESVTHAMWPY